MSNLVIRAEGLSKRYFIGETARKYSYKTIRDVISDSLVSPFRRTNNLLRGQTTSAAELHKAFWALKDVSFEVEHGEVIGIIGHNGAGKSTLLKILSRITEPTAGRIRIRGRVGSLLEVGTGFHPELTGRENIYLNGSILGMRKAEIERKFDEIVTFAEIDEFIDTPVKHYSSGMYVRLAFAVAAHLEPEILVVDEVLAVGDASFQRKCLGKMSSVAKEGRTVLFVSHNMTAILSLCSRAYMLDKGKIISSGQVDDVVNSYLQSNTSALTSPLSERKDRKGSGGVFLTSIAVESVNSQVGNSTITCVDRLSIQVRYQAPKPLQRPRLSISIYSYTNVRIYRLDSEATGELPETLPAEGSIKCVTGPINLMPGQYYINVAIYIGGKDIADYVEYACKLDVEITDFYGTGKLPESQSTIGLIGQTWSSEV